MKFFAKRYWHGLSSRSHLLVLILVPVVAYWIFAALVPDRYDIVQQVAITPQTPVSISTSPVEFQEFARLIESPGRFFSDPFALRELEPLIDLEAEETSQRVRSLQNLVNQHMGLEMADEEVAVVQYSGPDRERGEELVEFFAGRLVRKADEGLARAARERGLPTGAMADADPARLVGAPVVSPRTAWWRAERWGPLLTTALVSLLVMLLVIGLLEWSDPSFKSERDVSRYLGLPVLGSVPDLKELSRQLESGELD